MAINARYHLPQFVVNHIINAVQVLVYGKIIKRLPVDHIVDLRRYDQEAVLRCQRDCYNYLKYNIAIQ